MSFDAIRQVDAGVLSVGYAEAGPADGPVALLLHGWPYDIHAFADVVPRLADAGYRVLVPHLRGYGTTRFLDDATIRNGEQAALAVDAIAFLDAVGASTAVVAGFDWGARTACIMAALWPERCSGLVSVSGYLIGSQAAGSMPLPPVAELSWWYQFYFATERGRAGYEQNRRDFARLIWSTASPRWAFDDATFARSAASLDNPDQVAITIHNYRWRLGLAEGEAQYEELEQRLATAPTIGVPTITLEGDANGAPHPEPAAYAAKFTGPYEHRTIDGGIGHNLPQEAPAEFTDAVLDVARLEKDSTMTDSNSGTTVVLVHGAFADAGSFAEVTGILMAAGVSVLAPANPLRGLHSDSAYIASVFAQVSGPVLAVGHSYGGAVITNAATTSPNVMGLVFVAAFAPDENEALGEVAATSKDSALGPALAPATYPVGPATAAELYVRQSAFHEVFADDLTAEKSAVYAASQRPVAAAAFDERTGVPAWKTLPSWAIVATGDKAAGADITRSMAERAGADIIELDGSHVIMISRPQEVADVILRAVASVA